MSHHVLNRLTLLVAVVATAGFCQGQTARAADAEQTTTIPPSSSDPATSAKTEPIDWISFLSDRKIGMIQPTGAGEQYLDFPEHKQLWWQPTMVVLPDLRHIVLRSGEPPVDPKASFYDKKGAKAARSHLWLYDLARQDVQEIAIPTLMSAIGLMPGGKRMLVSGEEDPDNPNTRIYTVNLDGTDKRQFHELSGFAYCVTLSPDGKKVAFHNASEGYKIYAMDLDTGKQTLLAGESGMLNFGPEWSPDGQWVLYQRCGHGADPMNQWSDLCIVRADGSEKRLLTTGQRQWFGTSYGKPDNPGRGSNFPHWSPDGRWITYTRCSPGAQTAWVYRKDRPDTDHFNCDHDPDQAHGGSQICLVDVKTGDIREVTPLVEKQWVWRTAWSPDSTKLAYARAMVDDVAELWTINVDGSDPRFLTRGYQDKGADFPAWKTFSVAPNSQAKAAKWDYVRQPVAVTGNRKSLEPVLGLMAKSAFDGFGAQGERPAAGRAWIQHSLPTPASPIAAEIDYGKPIAVSAFFHYFYVPGSRNLHENLVAPSAYQKVRISCKNDGNDWSEVCVLNDLPVKCPQVLPVNATKPARFWRIEVLELAPGAEMFYTYELETWTGGMPEIKPWKSCDPDFLAEFRGRMSNHAPAMKDVCDKVSIQGTEKGFDVAFPAEGRTAKGTLELLIDGQPCTFQKSGNNAWQASTPSGDISLNAENTKMGLLLNLAFNAKAGDPRQYRRAALQMSAADVDLYYMPAYVWDTKKPADASPNTCSVQTRIAVLGTKDMMLLYVPGTDRGSLGFADGRIKNDLILGKEPTPVLLTALQGDWWKAYQFAVTDIYDFQEQPQTVPISEIQYGVSRYLLRDDIWEPTLGTLKSWPAYSPDMDLYGFDTYVFYGVPYSIPAYLARYAMNGDKLALERSKSIMHWLCASGVHVKDGPAKGAFLPGQQFGGGRQGAPREYNPVISMDRMGVTGAGLPVLTSQTTGAALWTLLYYRKATGDQSPEINQAIDDAAAWLLKTQTPDGGWPWGHRFHAVEGGRVRPGPDGSVYDPVPGSGCIWNIWALWRLGKDTGDQKYLDAATKAKDWYRETFLKIHRYNGYWDDCGPAIRDGYDAGIAAVVFGEMGEKELAVEAAKDAMQWVFTRQIEPRDRNCSAGLVSESPGWPAAAYCNPMMGLAGWTAWQASGDDFWKPYAKIPKAIGWWYQPETGAMVWILDSARMAPMVGPRAESWWVDWIIAQTGSITLRWLVREANLHSMGELAVDEDSLTGKAMGQNVRLWAPPGGLHPIIPPDGQVNWLGLRGNDSLMIAFWNDGNAGQISCPLLSGDVQGAALRPKATHHIGHENVRHDNWDGTFPVNIHKDEMVVLEWEIRQ